MFDVLSNEKSNHMISDLPIVKKEDENKKTTEHF
jgi:hypothetical protein